ncbi:MAG: hypothetical protein FWH21_08530, partial [Kiritimatiellaeota bacterium]|nr:hypothetical protein [Kiritimatiellota bacterium]
MVSRPGFVCVDSERLHNLVMYGTSASFGSAVALGDDRVEQLIRALRDSRLLRGRETLARAGSILVGILGGDDLRLTEIGDIKKRLGEWHHTDCRVELGTVLDPAFNGRIELVVFAFQSWAFPGASAEPPVLELGAVKATKQKRPPPKQPPETPGIEPNMWKDQNLDEPTFRRLQIRLDR